MSQQVIGVLVDSRVYNKIPLGSNQREVIEYYEEGGEMYNVIPCFFRLQDINLNNKTVYAYMKEGDNYVLKELLIPQVIHNRSMNLSKRAELLLRELTNQEIFLYNLRNRYSKYFIHQLLSKNAELINHLPDTKVATPSSLRLMMKQYDRLILKPNNGSLGIGIFKLSKIAGTWHIKYSLRSSKGNTQQKFKEITRKNLSLLQNIFRTRTYLIQQYIPLLTFNDHPFDLRVSVQRDATGKWQITGIVGKVATNGHYLSNVAQGGEVYPLEILLTNYPTLSLTDITSRINQLTLKIVNYMSEYLPNLADLGLDIGIVEGGKPYFIECNGRDLRYSFQLGGMIDEWKATFTNPIGYGAFIINKLNKVYDTLSVESLPEAKAVQNELIQSDNSEGLIGALKQVYL